MNKPVVVKALKQLGEAFELLSQAFGEDVSPEETKEVVAAPKAEKKATPKKKEVEVKIEVEVEDDEEPVKAPGKASNEITEDQLRTALVEFAQANSKDGAYAILKKYGAKKVNELKKEDFPRVLAELEM